MVCARGMADNGSKGSRSWTSLRSGCGENAGDLLRHGPYAIDALFFALFATLMEQRASCARMEKFHRCRQAVVTRCQFLALQRTWEPPVFHHLLSPPRPVWLLKEAGWGCSIDSFYEGGL